MSIRVPLLPRALRWAVVVALAGFVFYVSIVTVPPETAIDAWKPTLLPLDKWRHFLAYAAIGYALAYAITDWDLPAGRLAALVVGFVIVYGIGIEIGQSFIPGRYLSIGDAYANALGGLLVVPYYLVRRYLTFVPVGELVTSLQE